MQRLVRINDRGEEGDEVEALESIAQLRANEGGLLDEIEVKFGIICLDLVKDST